MDFAVYYSYSYIYFLRFQYTSHIQLFKMRRMSCAHNTKDRFFFLLFVMFISYLTNGNTSYSIQKQQQQQQKSTKKYKIAEIENYIQVLVLDMVSR